MNTDPPISLEACFRDIPEPHVQGQCDHKLMDIFVVAVCVALALVRQQLWFAYPTFRFSKEEPDMVKISAAFFDTLVSTLCYAA